MLLVFNLRSVNSTYRIGIYKFGTEMDISNVKRKALLHLKFWNSRTYSTCKAQIKYKFYFFPYAKFYNFHVVLRKYGYIMK